MSFSNATPQMIVYGTPSAGSTASTADSSGTSPPVTEVASLPHGTSVGGNAYALFLAFVVFGSMVYMINRTKVGHTLIYYALVLMILVTLATQYQFVVVSLGPLGRSTPGQKPQSAAA